jgi:hypothetical protein
MNKQDLIAAVADSSGLTKGDASKAVEAVFETEDLQPGITAGLDDRADDGIEARGIPSAREDADLAVFW